MRKIFTFLMLFAAMNLLAQSIEEPVVIAAPDTTIDKTAYTLTGEGVTISVSYGSAYPANHPYNNLDITYFACLAGGEITFTTEQPMKGIAINGWLKKNFSATCSRGTMETLADSYEDVTGDPVLTISDIDTTEVTISCVNQLRCFSVEVYFTKNPDDPDYIEEAVDTVFLNIVAAEAWDYSDSTDYSSEGAYSYWVRLKSAEQYPEVWLDMYAAVKGDLNGHYSLYDSNVGEYSYVQLSADELDYEYAYDQEFTIGVSTDGGTSYMIEGWLLAENDVLYKFEYAGPIAIVPPYYEEQGIEDIQEGVKVTKELRDGQLVIIRGGKKYSVLGSSL